MDDEQPDEEEEQERGAGSHGARGKRAGWRGAVKFGVNTCSRAQLQCEKLMKHLLCETLTRMVV